MSPEEKRALLARLLKEESGEAVSASQQRYWVLHEMEAAIPTHVSAAYEVRGELDTGLLQASWADVIERHEGLRKAFVGVEGEPRPVTVAAAWVVTPMVDVTGLPEPVQEAELQRLSGQEARRPFDLASAPLLHVTMLRRDEHWHVLLLTLHQLVADRASLGVLMRDLATAYSARAQGQAPVFAAAPASFAEFAARQRAWLESTEAVETLAYWQKQLAGLPVLRLPTDRPRPAVKAAGLRGARRRATLPQPLAAALTALGKACGGDSVMVVLAAWQLLLSRYSGQRDIAVGVPVANRSEEQWNHVAGPFENTLVIRTDLSGDPSFRQLLERVRAAWQAAQAHGRMPLERLIQGLQPVGDVEHSPLFQVQLIGETLEEWEAAPLRWAPLAVETGLAAFDLTLRVEQRAGQLRLEAEYSTDLFEVPTVDRLLGHLEVLLGAMASSPERSLSSVSLLTGSERSQLLEWNATAAPYARQSCLHELVEQQAGRTPQLVAVAARDGQLSYTELNERANALAHHLRELGVGPEVLVGVASDRSTATIVALLAVLKAGGAYVPLDPDYPAERLRFILDDAGIDVILAQPASAERIPLSGHKLVDPAENRPPAPLAPASGVGPDNLAYVIYTSGSTGQPKGVLVPHRQIVNSTVARWTFGRFSPGSYAMPAPLSFDASAAGIYWTLCTGGRLVLANSEQSQDPRLLARLIREERITHLTGMPWFYLMLLTAGRETLRSLRDVSVGGEAAPLQMSVEHHEVIPWARLYNDYGPTEASVWTTAYLCKEGEKLSSLPIGRPIQNARVYVLNGDLDPQPAGIPGELYIAGDGVARGYLNRPALTAERFVPNPFASAPGERMYRTGDLARYLADGNLDFLGRIDTQVKIRGFRVELGEIEAALQSHRDVTNAVVLAVQEQPGDTRLSAYIVPRAGEAPSREELTVFLERQLPPYMLPAWFTFLDELPQTRNGKIDRGALANANATADHARASGGQRDDRIQATPQATRPLMDKLSEREVETLLAGLLQTN